MASEATTVSPDAPRATLLAGPAAGLARRYAQALLDLARERKEVDRIASDVEALLALWRDDAPFRAFIADPRLDSAQQRKGAFAILDRAGIGGDVRNLVGVLVNNRRLAALPEVAQSFGTLLAAQRGQEIAEVTTAHPLTDTQRSQVVARLTEAGYSNVRLHEQVDPSILGGLIVKIGSRLYDTSIKSRLQRLSYAMKGAA